MSATTNGEQTLMRLFYNGTHLSFKKGEYIIRPGESPPGVFFIESGMVKAYDITKYGEENMLIIRREGEVFPLIWAITGQERKIVYEAICPTKVWKIDRDSLLELMESKPIVLQPLLDMTVEMYRIHSERIINLEYRTVRERLVSFLFTMAKRFGKKQPDDSLLITIPLRNVDIASSINASREATNRALGALTKRGLVSNKNSLITLNDPKALRKLL